MPTIKSSSYYFQCIVYDDKPLSILTSNYMCFVSPVHNLKEFDDAIVIYNENAITLRDNPPHRHVLIRSPNKKTFNSFMIDICKLFNNDLTDIKFHEEDSLVKNPEMVIRYYFHVDFPTKEQFQLDLYNYYCLPEFIPYFCKAFNYEILNTVVNDINTGFIDNCNTLVSYGPIFTYWYSLGNHSLLVHNLCTESLFISHKKGKL